MARIITACIAFLFLALCDAVLAANNAAFVSQTVPSPMAAGQTYSVSITMQNTGTTTWSSGSGYTLTDVATPTGNWGITNVPLPGSVSPGANVTFTFNVTAPTTDGTYSFQWKMKVSGSTFGTASTLLSIVVSHNNSQFVSQSVPPTMTPGQTYSVSITMQNTGTTTWSSSHGYKLTDNAAPTGNWGITDVSLPSSVSPGANVTFTFNVTAPTTSGTYGFQWKMKVSGSGTFGTASTLLSIVVSPNNSQFISQSVPSTMTTGQTYPVSVTFLNNGSTTWTTSAYHLGSQNPQDNTTWGLSRVNLTQSVAPNVNATFSFNAVAPTLPGSYNFQWQMLRDSSGPFGALSPNQAVVVSTGNNAQFIGQSVPTAMFTNQPYAVTVTFKNTGTSTWSPAANYDIASSNSVWTPSHATIPSGSTVPPGASYTYSFTLTAPSAAGTYTWQWRSAQEGIESFGDSTPSVSVTVAIPPPVQYAYDGLGRLTGVVDSSGSAARYVYDPTGNITRIDRPAAGSVAILGFEPPSGPIGTNVTISGVGFSATPSQNTVAFNGTAATVTSASTTQLIVAAPTGATTGAISVTAPGGSDSSVNPFVVQAATPAVTVQSFSPTSGAPGTSVAISGANFASTISSNEVKFNGFIAQQTSASPTSITALVPQNATSGHISVRTGSGSATSSGIFTVPLPGHSLSDVVEQATISIDGSSTTVSVANTSGTAIGLITFDGTVGQKLGLGISSVSYVGSGLASVTVYRPDRKNFGTLSTLYTQGGTLTLPKLPLTGTYSIVLAPASGTTATATFTLSTPLQGSSVVVDGAAAPVTSTRPGQGATYTFAYLSNQGYGMALMDASVGTTVYEAPNVLWPFPMPGVGVRNVTPLTSSGTATIELAPTTASPLNTTLSVLNDNVGTIPFDGTQEHVTIDQPGRGTLLSFVLHQQSGICYHWSPFDAPVNIIILNSDWTWNSNSNVGGGGPGTYYLWITPANLSASGVIVWVTATC